METPDMSTSPYEVITHHEVYGDRQWWVFDIPALGAVGQALSFDEIEDEARGIIAMWHEDGPAFEEVCVEIRHDSRADEH